MHAAGAGEHGTAGEGRANGGGGQSGQQGSSGDHGQNGQNGQNGQSPRRNTGTDTGYIARQLGIEGLGATRALAALSPTIGTLGSVYGSATLDRWRREDERRRAEARGDYASNWRQAVAAIETPVGNVRPGETTALRTRASPFAAYLVQMHDRIHETFAEGFISRVGGMPDGSPMNNPDLHSVLELAIDADGTIHHIRISQTSGWLPFDVGALNAVRAAAPFPETPEAIRSPDARVYVLWHFRRSQNFCNDARPFILRRAPPGDAPATQPREGASPPSPAEPAGDAGAPRDAPADAAPAEPAPAPAGSDPPGARRAA